MLLQWLRRKFARKPSPLDNCTPRVQKLFVLTRKQADRLHHHYVGTEHLLLALLELKEGVGYTALLAMQVDFAALQKALTEKIRIGKETTLPATIPYTPRVKKVLDYGAIEAQLLGHNYVGTEHLLLGLLHCGGGVAPDALKSQNIDLEKARAAVRLMLSPIPAEPPSEKAAGDPTAPPPPKA